VVHSEKPARPRPEEPVAGRMSGDARAAARKITLHRAVARPATSWREVDRGGRYSLDRVRAAWHGDAGGSGGPRPSNRPIVLRREGAALTHGPSDPSPLRGIVLPIM